MSREIHSDSLEGVLAFEQRKQEHINLSLDPRSQNLNLSGLEKIELIHEALPDLDFDEIDISKCFLGHKFSSPIFVSSMTAGHQDAFIINEILAHCCNEKNMMMAIGSQRKDFLATNPHTDWYRLKQKFPKLKLVGNLGIAQLIEFGAERVADFVNNLSAFSFYIHLNPLQEVLQPEGNVHWSGSWAELEKFLRLSHVPVLIKEVGSGFSISTIKRLKDIGVKFIDVAGKGGTHWGRIESLRSAEASFSRKSFEAFSDWGKSTADCLLDIKEENIDINLLASGGVRTGVDVAKYISLGAKLVGMAAPFMKTAIEDRDQFVLSKSFDAKKTIELMSLLEYQLKISLFCTGSKNVDEIENKFELVR